MEIYKFGGASVRNADGIRNLEEIVRSFKGELVVVVSALGKTTNALENLVKAFLENDPSLEQQLETLESFHTDILLELDPQSPGREYMENSFSWLRGFLEEEQSRDYDYVYDQVVSLGEVWSTKIVEGWLARCDNNSFWMDIRSLLITDDRFRDANVNWKESERRIREEIRKQGRSICVTQGFIGGTPEGKTTTLGREGSDFTAGILANILDADSVTIWKDVPGVLNADPEWLPDTEKLDRISYKEAVEMSFSGAKVIHPKTIKPLHNKKIPLFVKSFLSPNDTGTIVSSDESLEQNLPLFIKKENQVLLSIIPRDFSFVIGDNLGKLFTQFYAGGIKVNLVQTSAVSIAVSADNDEMRLNELIETISEDYKVLINEDTELITLRYYDEKAISKIIEGREVLLEQRTRKSLRLVLK